MIYLDNAATTAVHSEVLAAMLPYLQDEFGNPSSTHAYGRRARRAIDEARSRVAEWLMCEPSNLIFTSGGTEADHTAIFGAFLGGEGRKHLITTGIEHHAVLDTCLFLQHFGVEVTVVQPDATGVVRAADVLAALRPDTFCVSVMSVNNELGTIQPIVEIAERVKTVNPQVCVHSDMVQGAGGYRIPLSDTAIDMASVSAHKIHGPKGIGALYIKPGTRWKPVLHGGSQEKKRRAGTENIASIVGFGAAAKRMHDHWDAHLRQLHTVRQAFLNSVAGIPGLRVNSVETNVPSIVNVAFEGVKSETLLMRLDMSGVAASSGSACTAGSTEPSHVLMACGMSETQVNESVRFSFSDMTTVEEVEQAGRIVATCVGDIRDRASRS